MHLQQQKALMTARSTHSGGVMALTCDGAVQFVANAIELSAWRAVATRQAEEVAAEF
jgi:hypothetical protein